MVLSILLLSSAVDSQISITDPLSVTNGDDNYGYRSPKLAVVDNDQLVVFWSEPGNFPNLYISKMEGDEFSDPLLIPLNGVEADLWSGNLGPGIAAYQNHIYVAFEVYGEAIYCIHSADSGETWADPVLAFIPENNRRATIPNIAVDSSGQPYIAYVNTDEQEQDAHYGLVKSQDFGASFSSEVMVNELLSKGNVCECCNGNIEIDSNGTIFVGFRNNSNGLRDCWIAMSTNNGSSFTEVFDVDATDWELNGCPNNGPDFTVSNEGLTTTFYSSAAGFDTGLYFSTLNPVTSEVSQPFSIVPSAEGATNQTAGRIATDGLSTAIVYQDVYQLGYNIGVTITTSGLGDLGTESFYLNDAIGSQKQPEIIHLNNSFHVVYEDVTSGTVMYQEIKLNTIQIDEQEAKWDFKVYPNPTDNYLYISSLSGFQDELFVYNAMGILIEKIQSSGFSHVLNTSSYKTGAYYIKAVIDSEITTEVFVKN